MKKLIYIQILISLLFSGTIFSQQENNSNVADNTVETLEKTDSAKPLFGSKEYKESIGIVESKKEESENLMLKTCLSLAAVIGLIIAIFYALKKVNNRLYSNGKSNPLRVFSRMPLDNKNYLTLVRVYEEEFLLSVGPNGTTVVARYALIDHEDQEEGERTVSEDGKRTFSIDQETHVTSINLKPVNELNNEKI